MADTERDRQASRATKDRDIGLLRAEATVGTLNRELW